MTVFPVNSATVSPGKSATQFPDSSAAQSPGSNVPVYPLNRKPRSAEVFPESSVEPPRDKNARQFQGIAKIINC